MKKIVTIVTIVLLTFPVFSQAPPPNGSNVPIDGASLIMLFVGAALGIKKLLQKSDD